MSRQEIRGEDPRERRHVAERMVLERVHVSEIGCNVSVKLEAGVEL